MTFPFHRYFRMHKKQSYLLRSAGELLLYFILFLLLTAIVYVPHVPLQGFTLRSMVREVCDSVQDPSAQWIFTGSFTILLFTIALLELHRSSKLHCARLLPFWILLAGGSASFAYFRHYDQASQSRHALIFICGLTLAISIRFVLHKCNRLTKSIMEKMPFILAAILSTTSVQETEGTLYRYIQEIRWTGIFNNPNNFGLLMAVAFIIASAELYGFLFLSPPTCNQFLNVGIFACLLTILFCSGAGLFNSYSRAAWIGAAFGLIYVFWAHSKERTNIRYMSAGSDDVRIASTSTHLSLFPKQFLPVLVIGISVIVIALRNFGRSIDQEYGRRLFSIANWNDFSSQNRLAAWEGALQTAVDNMWLGCGWNVPDKIYAFYYCATRIDDPSAILLNDYFTLGMSLGVVGVVSMMGIIHVSFNQFCCNQLPADQIRIVNTSEHINFSSTLSCRAGAIVLLVGFWFDGGLFQLSTAMLAWLMMSWGVLSNQTR